VPKKGYRSLTLKAEVYGKLMNAIRETKKKNPKINNNRFIEQLLEEHRKGSARTRQG